MTINLNHTIVVGRDQRESAGFLTDILGLPPYKMVGHFAVVQVGPTSLDFVTADSEIERRHFAFLLSESEFDQVFDRIRRREMHYWADPFRKVPGQINHWDDGRGVYFDDPNGHLLEIITRPYCSAGPDAANPNPLCFPDR
jgi:catechol 2,3-dioxygenase-like lactoylglutathione lyase family enzyme